MMDIAGLPEAPFPDQIVTREKACKEVLQGLMAQAIEAKDFVAAAQIATAIHLGPRVLSGRTQEGLPMLTVEFLEVFRAMVVSMIHGMGKNDQDLYMSTNNARMASAIKQFSAAVVEVIQSMRFGPKSDLKVNPATLPPGV